MEKQHVDPYRSSNSENAAAARSAGRAPQRPWARRLLVLPALTLLVTQSLLLAQSYFGENSPAAGRAGWAKTAAESRRGATVQITMTQRQSTPIDIAPLTGGNDEWRAFRVRSSSAQGIGTVLAIGGQAYIMTHNHWPVLVRGEMPDQIQISDSQGRQLLTLNGTAFRDLVVYRDAGTLIMQAPAAVAQTVATPARPGRIDTLAPGQQLLVARRSASPNQLAFIRAELLNVRQEQGVTQLQLRNLTMTSIEPGDSGGGIWLDGMLVGNIWQTVREAQRRAGQATELRATTEWIGAGLSPEIIALIKTLQSPPGLPPPPTAGRS